MDLDEPVRQTRRRRITAADVARLSGVSRATVSYVLNNTPGQSIPDATRRRVQEAAAELAYVPSAAAASLRRGHSRIVVVVTERALSGFITEPFLSGIAEGLTTAGLVAVSHQFSTDDGLRALISEIRPYGIIALTALSDEATASIADAGVPQVYSSTRGNPRFPRPWEEEIGRLQADHLIEQGARQILYVSPGEENPRIVIARSREIGAQKACAAAGVPHPPHVELSTDMGSAIATLEPIVNAATTRIGICAFDDDVAAVALSALTRLGVDVPNDVGVIGVDNTPFSAFLTPPLTTIAVDGRGAGRRLVERFLTAGASDLPDADVAATLVRRAST